METDSMKKFLTLFVFFICAVTVNAQNFSLEKRYVPDVYCALDFIEISENQISYRIINSKDIHSIQSKNIHIDGLPFIKLSEKMPKEISEEYFYRNKEVITDDKILLLACKETDSNSIILFATTKGFYNYEPFIKPFHGFEIVSQCKDCSSFLTETNKEYPVSNLSELKVDTPWVEGAPGYGIGEGFTIVNSRRDIMPPFLFIMNGYISYEKPYLYKQNGRVKKIKVKGLKSGKEKVLDVLDTPHPQTVDISFITEPEDIRVTIEEVYPGTKYEDTCIHYMITYFDEVIPYENNIDEFLSMDNFDK